MQTFLISPNPIDTAKILDDRRLFKQIVEGNQIATCLLIKETKWKNHPAVKMWKDYPYFLINNYIYSMIYEWTINRKRNATKSLVTFSNLKEIVTNHSFLIPHWFTNEFFISHQSNLIRKNPIYYTKYFGNNIPKNLPYIWPV